MKIVAGLLVSLWCVTLYGAEDMLLRARTELLVEQAGELLAEANRKGSPTHNPALIYYFGMMYGCGTNLLARPATASNASLMRKYADLVQKNYDAYTKVEAAMNKAAATGNDRVHAGRRVVYNGSRTRASRMVSAERLGDKELATAIKQWEDFVRRLR